MRNRIDYGLNMKLCVCLGIISLALWVRVYLIERSEALFKVSLISIASALLLGLEILDFPPLYRIFDAHSLWHCGTRIIHNLRDINAHMAVMRMHVFSCF